MRAALWLLALFSVAVALALFAGNNQSTVTLFWPPHRVDVSLNLVLLTLLAVFVALHVALRALGVLMELPRQARRWRLQQRERATHAALLDALAYWISGRFIRARKAAELALSREASLAAAGESMDHALPLRAISHLVAAESAHALQDKTLRDQHLDQALAQTNGFALPLVQEIRQGTQLRAARWSLENHDAGAALAWLDALPQGAARRTVALRLRLKAARLSQQHQQALDTARLLVKHRAFSAAAAHSIVRSLASELIAGANDPGQLQRVWNGFDEAERAMPELAIQAAQRLAALHGDPVTARAWLLPIWQTMVEQPDALAETLQIRLVSALEAGLDGADGGFERDWLVRIESAQQHNPRNASLQYLAGMACLKRQLWGKAQQLLGQATQGLHDAGLLRSAWRALALLAEQRGDEPAAAQAWKRAAQGG